MSEHTPGPWWVDPEGPEYSVNYKGPLDTFRHVALVSCYIGRIGDKEVNEANARLIAAAPDLLAALEEMVELFRGEFKDPTGPVKRSKDAIEKATGVHP